MISSPEPVIMFEPSSQENMDNEAAFGTNDCSFSIEKISWNEHTVRDADLLHPSSLSSLWSPSPTPSFNDDDDFLSPVGSVMSLQESCLSASDSPFLPQNTITYGSPYNPFRSLTPEPLLSETINPVLLSGYATPASPLSPVMSEYLSLEQFPDTGGLEEQLEDESREEYIESSPYAPAPLSSSRCTTKRKRTPSPLPSPGPGASTSRPTKRTRVSSPSLRHLPCPDPSSPPTVKRKRARSPSPSYEPTPVSLRHSRWSAKMVAPQYTDDDDSDYEEPKAKKSCKRRKTEIKGTARAETTTASTPSGAGKRRNHGNLTKNDVDRLSINKDGSKKWPKPSTPCEICGKVEAWAGASDWRRHLFTHLSDEERENNRFHCARCPRTFGRLDSLKRHLDHSCKGKPRGT